jgi:hypothetical protein
MLGRVIRQGGSRARADPTFRAHSGSVRPSHVPGRVNLLLRCRSRAYRPEPIAYDTKAIRDRLGRMAGQMEKAVMSGTLVRPCAVILNKKITSINEALA